MQDAREEVEEILRGGNFVVEFEPACVTLRTVRILLGIHGLEAPVKVTRLTSPLADYFLELGRALADINDRIVELTLAKGHVSCLVSRFGWAEGVEDDVLGILRRDLLSVDERLKRDNIASAFGANLLFLTELRGRLRPSDLLHYLECRLGPLPALRQFTRTN